MNEYSRDIFYNVDKLSVYDKKNILKDAKEKSYDWHVDILKNGNTARQQINMSFEDILLKLESNCHFVFIHRRGYEEWKSSNFYNWNIEVGFATMYGSSYYLFINMKEKELDYFIEKYKLKKMKN